jgi:hydrogenase maturation protease
MSGEKNAFRLCVVGIGNEFRGDDCAGLLVARRLRQITDVEIHELRGDIADLTEILARCTHVVLVDAVQSQNTPGTIIRLEVGSAPLPATAFRCSSHLFGIHESVELCRALGKLPQHLIFYGIEAARFDPGEPPTPEIVQAADATAERIRLDIHHWTPSPTLGDNQPCTNIP